MCHRISGTLQTITDVVNNGLFIFNEQITNLGNTARIETINLKLVKKHLLRKRYSIGSATTSVELIDTTSETPTPIPANTFVVGDNYQIRSEIVTITGVTNGSESTTLTVSQTGLEQQQFPPRKFSCIFY